jgi:hypothetical protein
MPDPKAIYAAFSPAPLTTDQTDLYVDLDAVRGSSGVVHRLAQRIQLADRPTAQVLAGHKGTGKTTELYLLKKHLSESIESKFFVVMVSSDEELDRNDVDFPELLIAIIRQIAVQLRSAGIEVSETYLKSRFEWLKTQLGKTIELDSVKLETSFLKLGMAAKGSPDARRLIREHLEPDVSNWLTAANELISSAQLQLSNKGYAGLVVLVDDLDKMVVRSSDDGHTTASDLFVNRAAQLTGFNCHLVYSMPLSLAYSHHEAAIRSSFGGAVPVIPMIKVQTVPPNQEPYAPGMKCLRGMIAARLKSADATEKDMFKAGVRDAIIRLSGGQPSELMVLIREAMIAGDLPISLKALDRVKLDAQRAYARILHLEHWPIIEQVRQTGQLLRDEKNESLIRELLDSRSVLQYLNGEEWYGLNPAVAALTPPAQSQPS